MGLSLDLLVNCPLESGGLPSSVWIVCRDERFDVARHGFLYSDQFYDANVIKITVCHKGIPDGWHI
jgi:hypothetical protein